MNKRSIMRDLCRSLKRRLVINRYSQRFNGFIERVNRDRSQTVLLVGIKLSYPLQRSVLQIQMGHH